MEPSIPTQTECSICLTELEFNGKVKLSCVCGNTFCQDCFSLLKNKRNMCPKCRKPFDLGILPSPPFPMNPQSMPVISQERSGSNMNPNGEMAFPGVSPNFVQQTRFVPAYQQSSEQPLLMNPGFNASIASNGIISGGGGGGSHMVTNPHNNSFANYPPNLGNSSSNAAANLSYAQSNPNHPAFDQSNVGIRSHVSQLTSSLHRNLSNSSGHHLTHVVESSSPGQLLGPNLIQFPQPSSDQYIPPQSQQHVQGQVPSQQFQQFLYQHIPTQVPVQPHPYPGANMFPNQMIPQTHGQMIANHHASQSLLNSSSPTTYILPASQSPLDQSAIGQPNVGQHSSGVSLGNTSLYQPVQYTPQQNPHPIQYGHDPIIALINSAKEMPSPLVNKEMQGSVPLNPSADVRDLIMQNAINMGSAVSNVLPSQITPLNGPERTQSHMNPINDQGDPKSVEQVRSLFESILTGIQTPSLPQDQPSAHPTEPLRLVSEMQDLKTRLAGAGANPAWLLQLSELMNSMFIPTNQDMSSLPNPSTSDGALSGASTAVTSTTSTTSTTASTTTAQSSNSSSSKVESSLPETMNSAERIMLSNPKVQTPKEKIIPETSSVARSKECKPEQSVHTIPLPLTATEKQVPTQTSVQNTGSISRKSSSQSEKRTTKKSSHKAEASPEKPASLKPSATKTNAAGSALKKEPEKANPSPTTVDSSKKHVESTTLTPGEIQNQDSLTSIYPQGESSSRSDERTSKPESKEKSGQQLIDFLTKNHSTPTSQSHLRFGYQLSRSAEASRDPKPHASNKMNTSSSGSLLGAVIASVQKAPTSTSTTTSEVPGPKVSPLQQAPKSPAPIPSDAASALQEPKSQESNLVLKLANSKGLSSTAKSSTSSKIPASKAASATTLVPLKSKTPVSSMVSTPSKQKSAAPSSSSLKAQPIPVSSSSSAGDHKPPISSKTSMSMTAAAVVESESVNSSDGSRVDVAALQRLLESSKRSEGYRGPLEWDDETETAKSKSRNPPSSYAQAVTQKIIISSTKPSVLIESKPIPQPVTSTPSQPVSRDVRGYVEQSSSHKSKSSSVSTRTKVTGTKTHPSTTPTKTTYEEKEGKLFEKQASSSQRSMGAKVTSKARSDRTISSKHPASATASSVTSSMTPSSTSDEALHVPLPVQGARNATDVEWGLLQEEYKAKKASARQGSAENKKQEKQRNSQSSAHVPPSMKAQSNEAVQSVLLNVKSLIGSSAPESQAPASQVTSNEQKDKKSDSLNAYYSSRYGRRSGTNRTIPAPAPQEIAPQACVAVSSGKENPATPEKPKFSTLTQPQEPSIVSNATVDRPISRPKRIPNRYQNSMNSMKGKQGNVSEANVRSSAFAFPQNSSKNASESKPTIDSEVKRQIDFSYSMDASSKDLQNLNSFFSDSI